MRRLNLVGVPRTRMSEAPAAERKALALGGVRVFLDPGTLEAFEARAGERPGPAAGLEPEFRAGAHQGAKAIVLSVTRGCNLACSYCYVRRREGGSGPAAMSRETAARALSLLSPPGPWRVGFFGGEPMLQWDLVREVAGAARRRADREGARVGFSITTNGTLLTPGRAGFLASERFSLIVSLDGPRDLHDAERRCRGGSGSFDMTMAGLEAARSAGLGGRTTLRATFPLDRPELARRLRFLNDLADEGYARNVSVEPGWPARGDAAPTLALEREYLAAALWALDRLRGGRPVRFHHLTKALERVLLMRPAGTECGAGLGYLDVAPDGSVYACHKEAGRAIGHVATGVVERERAAWRENRWYGREGCFRCWARNVCGGGCRALSVEHTDSIARPWPVACAARRLQVRAALLVAARAPKEALAAAIGMKPGRRDTGVEEPDALRASA